MLIYITAVWSLPLRLEVYNRYFWRTLFACNFQINKKHTHKLQNFYLYPQISIWPPPILKNNQIKKGYLQSQTVPVTLIYTKK